MFDKFKIGRSINRFEEVLDSPDEDSIIHYEGRDVWGINEKGYRTTGEIARTGGVESTVDLRVNVEMVIPGESAMCTVDTEISRDKKQIVIGIRRDYQPMEEKDIDLDYYDRLMLAVDVGSKLVRRFCPDNFAFMWYKDDLEVVAANQILGAVMTRDPLKIEKQLVEYGLLPKDSRRIETPSGFG